MPPGLQEVSERISVIDCGRVSGLDLRLSKRRGPVWLVRGPGPYQLRGLLTPDP